jgi:lysophospholipase L1-like esterase
MKSMLHAMLRPLSVLAAVLTLSTPLQAKPAGNATATDLPKVLLIGDSITGGYRKSVTLRLKDRADVQMIPGNGEHTGTGLKMIDQWLGDVDWDVIHFNWGLWDLCYRHPKSKVQGNRDKENGTLTMPLDDYGRNLEKLVIRLKKTNAKLIWASTTVVPEGEAGRKVGDDAKYNEVAAKVMAKHGVAVDDLNKLTKTFGPEMFSKPGDVHYNRKGNERLAEQVASVIGAALRDL